MRNDIDKNNINKIIKFNYQTSSFYFLLPAIISLLHDRTTIGSVLSITLIIQSILSYKGDTCAYLLNKDNKKWELADRVFCFVTLFVTLFYFFYKKKKIKWYLVVLAGLSLFFWISGMYEIRKNDIVNENKWALYHTLWHLFLTILITLIVLQK